MMCRASVKHLFGIYYKKLTKYLFIRKNCFTFAPQKSIDRIGV